MTVRTLGRTLRSWPVGVRKLFVVVLAAVLAMGTLVVGAPKAYAAVTELRAALKTGADLPAPLVADSRGVVVGAHRSTDAGVSWTSDETLTTMHESGTWISAYSGSLYGISGAHRAVAYDIAGGTAATYALPTGSWSQMNGTWVMATTDTGGSAYNFVTGVAPAPAPPAGTTVLGSLSAQLGRGDAVVWHATSASDGTSVFAVAPSPSQAAAPWVAIAGVKDWTLDGSQLIYAFDSPTGLKLCVRPLTNLEAPPVCAAPDPSRPVPTPYGVDIFVVGGRTFLSAHYDTGVTKWYVTNGLAMDEVQVPSGSSVDSPLRGDVAHVVLRDADSVPSFKKVNLDGTLSAAFSNPATALSTIEGLAVAPGRIVGADNSDASNLTFPAWSRMVSGTLGAETALPKRASGLAASAGRTAVSGRDGLSMLDRGTVKHTFGDAHLGQLSGPYVTQPLLDASFNPYVVVSKADGTEVARVPTWTGVLFGSRYLSFNPVGTGGAVSVTVKDLTGAVSDVVVPLAASSAACTGWAAWNDLVAATCDSGHAVRAFSLKTGDLVVSNSSTEALLSIKELGDGYAVIYGTNGYQLWTVATNQLSQLVDCQAWAVSDGVGHVACSSRSELIWRDYSSLSTSAGRVLGWNAPAIFATDATSWTPEIDVSKAFNAGTLTIKQGSTIVRELTVPASTDGSVRGVSWDGKNTSGALVAGTFTVTLMVSGTDGSGPVLALDGTTAPTFSVMRSMPGSFVALTPSRLLDTRDGTGVPAPGALAASGIVDLQVTGRAGVPSSGVGAVILNVTAVTPTGSGFLTVYPTGGAVPNSSNVNFTAGQVVPNLVVAKVGTGGKVSIRNTSPGTTQVVADVAGYFVDGTVTDPGGLTALTPSRLRDTRNTGIVPANGSVTIQAAGVGGLPAASAVSAVVVNLTAVTPAGSGFLTAYPTGGAIPNASNVNFTAGQVVPNLAFVKLAADGSFTVKNSSPGTTDVVADVAGYIQAGDATGSGMFVSLAPTRVLDTRPVYGGSGAVGANAVKSLTLAGVGGVPASGVSGVVLNVTAVSTAAGFLTVFPAGVTAPNASNVNFTAGQVVPNLVAVKTSVAVAVEIRNSSAGATNVIADVAGYFRA